MLLNNINLKRIQRGPPHCCRKQLTTLLQIISVMIIIIIVPGSYYLN